MNILGWSHNAHVENLNAYQVEGGLHLHPEDKSLFDLLEPIEDASHTRDRKRSPPDSACARGTRVEVVNKVTTWSSSDISEPDEPHILWMHGYVGCGKSAVSQEVSRKWQLQGRPVASFFFFRGAAHRSRVWRLAPTLANQMAASVPETAPSVRAAVTSNPGLKNFPFAKTSVAMQMQCLVYGPFKTAMERSPMGSLGGRPFLIVIDGLDECEDKDETQDLIEGMLAFFDENPLIPLRVFITSRVEQHIQSRLDVPGVRLFNLVDHCSDGDIATLLDVLFENERRNPVVRAYVSEHGEWPKAIDKALLIKHIGGSFIFASSVFKFIMGSNPASNHPTTPMDRLCLALNMNPGLDGFYAQTLALSQHLPHFLDIISTIALLTVPLPTSGIAELLGISTYEVVNVLVNLQAIIQVPGTDNTPVTLFHTSLRDFLTTQSRSDQFFALPCHHARLFLRCLHQKLVYYQHHTAAPHPPSPLRPAAAYALQYSWDHLMFGKDLFQLSEIDSAVQLCRELLGCRPGVMEAIQVAFVIQSRGNHTGSLVDLDEAISLWRGVLGFQTSHHLNRFSSLTRLAGALQDRYQLTRTVANLEEAISLHHEALELERAQPSPSGRLSVLRVLSRSLHDMYNQSHALPHLQEAIAHCEELLAFHLLARNKFRLEVLNRLASLLQMRFDVTGQEVDLSRIASLKAQEALIDQDGINASENTSPYIPLGIPSD